jgi:hypothetical protein
VYSFQDGKYSDKKRGYANDLDLAFVTALFQLGACSYCEETELRLTLDRIDNTKGHTKVNVVLACVRCNYLRRDMPHPAWVTIVPTLKAVRQQGLFGEWVGGAVTRASSSVS